MKKIEELTNVLDFYVKANKLKTKIYDEKNNYTISDSLFGAITLAVAMNSEFKETGDLTKIIKIMVLDEFSKNNPGYDFRKKLKKGSEFQELIDEAREMKTLESRLALKYRTLDFALTQLIRLSRNFFTNNELIKEAITYFYLDSNESDKVEEVVKFYLLNLRLKNKDRSGWDKTHWDVKANRIERVSEHIVSTILLAMVMNSEMEYEIDIEKIIKMLSIHEVGETLIGDITPFDGITPEEKQKMEQSAMRDAVGKLSEAEDLLQLLYEFDDRKSKEALFAYLCDKMEADLQSKFYQDNNQHRTLNDQENNSVFKLPIINEILAKKPKTAFDVWYLWDEKIYKNSPYFEEFYDLLKMVKDNNIFEIKKGVIKEKIKLTRKEHKFLVDELSKMIKALESDEDIEGIIALNVKTDDNKGTLIIDLVLEDDAYHKKFEKLISKLTQSFEKINNTSVSVEFRYHYENEYCFQSKNPSDLYIQEKLRESTIILDKTGTLTRMKNSKNNISYSHLFHLVDYIPPINEQLLRKLEK